MKIMESPQMYDTTQPMVQIELKKITMANNNNNNNTSNNNNNNPNTPNNNNNNSVTAVNHNVLAAKQQQHQHLQTTNNNNNLILQKHLVPQYTQSDIDELTSQEISLDLQHLIDDQFRAEQESLGIFTEMVNGNSNSNNTPNGLNGTTPKSMHVQNNRSQQNQNFSRTTLPYMPQPVHTGATYTNSSDENSSVGSDVASSIKEEPVDHDYRRLVASSGGQQFLNNNNNNTNNNNNNTGLYNIPPNYASNGSGNTFTTLTPSTVLHHQGLGHLSGNHLAGLKNKQLLNHRKQTPKHIDKGTDEYRRRRERNNIAVRKSREKAKVRSREVEEKVKTLVKEKEVLIRRLEEMTNEIQLHKQLYMHLMNHSNPEINQICRNVLSLVNLNDHACHVLVLSATTVCCLMYVSESSEGQLNRIYIRSLIK